MSIIMKSPAWRVAGMLALGAATAIAVLLLRVPTVQAQGVMSAPACQCSAPTSIVGTSGRIAHCICGVMACAVTEYGDAGGKSSQLQCVRQ